MTNKKSPASEGFPVREICVFISRSLSDQLCFFQSGTKGEVENDRAQRRDKAVDEGNAAGDLTERLCNGVILSEDKDVAEVADEGVGDDIDQKAGSRRDDNLGKVRSFIFLRV